MYQNETPRLCKLQCYILVSVNGLKTLFGTPHLLALRLAFQQNQCSPPTRHPYLGGGRSTSVPTALILLNANPSASTMLRNEQLISNR
jgi:hypothetical protein